MCCRRGFVSGDVMVWWCHVPVVAWGTGGVWISGVVHCGM